MMTKVATHPIAVLVAFRWLAWLIALVGIVFGAGTMVHGIGGGALLALTGLAALAETALAWRPEFRPPLAGGARRTLLALAAVDTLLSLGAVYFSGGWSSPFYHYAVTSLLVPAFILPLGPALSWAVGFVLAYCAVGIADARLVGDTGALLGRRIGPIATPLLVVVVEWYLVRLVVARQREHERAERALAETEALFRVSEAIVTNLADVSALLDGIVEAARHTRRFSAFRVCLPPAGGADPLDRGFDGAGSTAGTRTVPLELRGERLGTLTLTLDPAALADGRDTGSTTPPFVEALAQQTALGVYDARLFAQREELATQAERARIAREIHDGMAQSLYMLSLGLEACADASDDAGATQASPLQDRLQALVGVSKQALWEARRYIFDLAPSGEGERSLVAMLQNLTREFETASRVTATLTLEGEPRRVPPPVAAALYRIGQEALANVFKHARADHAAITLLFLPDAVRLTIQDDGRGLAADAPGGHGLGNMRRRAEDHGGLFTVAAMPGGGTRVRAEVPTE